MRTGAMASMVVVIALVLSGLLALGLDVHAGAALAQLLPLAVAAGVGMALLVGLERGSA